MRYIRRLFEHHARKMRNIVARGVVAMVQDELKLQTNQIRLLDGELIDGAERCQQYGFTSYPLNGAECFVVFAGAGREHPLILSADDRRYRFRDHKPGEVRIYTDEGDYILFKRDNTIEVRTKHLVVNAEEDVTVNTKVATINASDEVTVETAQYNLKADLLNWEIGAWSVKSRSGEGMVTATVDMNLAQNGWHTTTGDQTAGTISQMHHVHTTTQPGGGTSGEPQG
jgi:phage baseplate assembly protein V